MGLPALEARLQQHAADHDLVALTHGAKQITYAELGSAIDRAEQQLSRAGIVAGDAVLLSCSFSPSAITTFLALLRLNAIAVLCAANDTQIERKLVASGSIVHLPNGELSELTARTLSSRAREPHPLVQTLKQAEHPGFVVFSSGSSGEPKAVLHDARRFCEHLKNVQKAMATIGFLAFDHIAGVDTLLYTLFAGGRLILVDDRSPSTVCKAIEAHKAQVLPVSPSFLKLLLLSPALRNSDLSSLEIVTFGSEPPDPAVTEQLAMLLPGANLLQKYGTSEFGAPRSKTRPGDSRWIKLRSENFDTHVEDGILWVKASGTMLGYLNVDLPDADSADAALVADGWFCTGDRVEADGDWLRILGRDSDMINVGGEKVFPAEVEGIVEGLAEVLECAVSGEPHALLGNVVVATLRLVEQSAGDMTSVEAKKLVRAHCKGKMARHAIPVKIRLTTDSLTTDRGKRQRK